MELPTEYSRYSQCLEPIALLDLCLYCHKHSVPIPFTEALAVAQGNASGLLQECLDCQGIHRVDCHISEGKLYARLVRVLRKPAVAGWLDFLRRKA